MMCHLSVESLVTHIVSRSLLHRRKLTSGFEALYASVNVSDEEIGMC